MTIKIACGPEAIGFGSWEWIGADLAAELGPEQAVTFRERVPAAEFVLFVKFKPSVDQLSTLRLRSRLIYCPVDLYGSAAEIDADWEALRQFDCILSHSSALMKYFSAYSRTEYIDHHVKYLAPLPVERKRSGPILWTGNAANLPPLCDWIKRHTLPEELWILTNLEGESTRPADYGFQSNNRIRIDRWSPELHREWATLARAAMDIKGNDFRARHKPPTKAFDFIASGLPLAMNLDSQPVLDVTRRGLKIVTPDEIDRWFSQEYWDETQQLGKQLLRDLSRPQVAKRLLGILHSL